MSDSTALSALIVGATGAVGRHTLRELLQAKSFSRVAEYGRRVTPASDLPQTRAELEQKEVDFEKIDEYGLHDAKFDTVIITLGTTRANAGSIEKFYKIDREYVLNTARAARVDGLSQRLVYVSSVGANSSSLLPYTKSKGLTEEGLAKLGYDDVIILRPAALLNRNVGESRILETIFGKVMTGIASVTGTKSASIDVADVAKSIIVAAVKGSSNLPAGANVLSGGGSKEVPKYTIIPNSGQHALAALNSFE